MIKTVQQRERAVMKRVAVYLPDAVYEVLEAHAEREGRSISNLASYLIENGLRQTKPIDSKRVKKEESKG